jgi:hypothetical protein
MSKGSNPRPYSIGLDKFADNWGAIFKKDKTMKTGTCGCGRSPTGDCIGWHVLSEEDYQAAHEVWLLEQKDSN